MPLLERIEGQVDAFRNVKTAEVVNTPAVTVCVLPSAFKHVQELTMENAGRLEANEELIAVIERKRREEEERRAVTEAAKNQLTLSSSSQLGNLNETVGVLVVANHFNSWSSAVFDLSTLRYLKTLRVGDECFSSITDVKITGLKYLESVTVGNNSFRNSSRYSTRHFSLKDCPKLKSLWIGAWSFTEFNTCEIENVDSLEVLQIGTNERHSNNFYYTGVLELKSAFCSLCLP